jgi:aryl-alcohol dehydrogenase-like predicted oxidoreductase
MIYKVLGKSGLRVSKLCLGGMTFEGGEERKLGENMMMLLLGTNRKIKGNRLC